MSLDAFSSTIERLYAAAADPEGWNAALRAVEDLTGSAGAVLCFVPDRPDERPAFVLAGRFTAEQCEEYARDYTPICPRTALARRRPDLSLHYDALLGSEAELDRDPTYQWFESRGGVRYYLGALLMSAGGYHVNTSIQRTRAQGHVQKSDLELYERLRPHLVQALRLSELVGTLGADRRFALASLDRLAHGIAVLDGEGRLIFANPAAETILAANDGLTVTRGRLGAADASAARGLRRLVATTGAEHGHAGGWLRLPRPSGRRDYAVFVAPLVVDHDSTFAAPPRVLVAIFDLDRPTGVDGRTLEALFGLSAKQAEMAALLARGRELSAVASELGITLATARSHLKTMFRKLEVDRQQDLVGLLARLGMMRDRTLP